MPISKDGKDDRYNSSQCCNQGEELGGPGSHMFSVHLAGPPIGLDIPEGLCEEEAGKKGSEDSQRDSGSIRGEIGIFGADLCHFVQRLIVTTHVCGMAIPNDPVVEVAFAVLIKAERETTIGRESEELSLLQLLVHFNAEEEGIVQEEEQPKPEEIFVS